MGEVVGGVSPYKRALEFEVEANVVDARTLWNKRLEPPSSQVFASSVLSIEASFKNKSKKSCDICFYAKQTHC